MTGQTIAVLYLIIIQNIAGLYKTKIKSLSPTMIQATLCFSCTVIYPIVIDFFMFYWCFFSRSKPTSVIHLSSNYFLEYKSGGIRLVWG